MTSLQLETQVLRDHFASIAQDSKFCVVNGKPYSSVLFQSVNKDDSKGSLKFKPSTIKQRLIYNGVIDFKIDDPLLTDCWLNQFPLELMQQFGFPYNNSKSLSYVSSLLAQKKSIEGQLILVIEENKQYVAGFSLKGIQFSKQDQLEILKMVQIDCASIVTRGEIAIINENQAFLSFDNSQRSYTLADILYEKSTTPANAGTMQGSDGKVYYL